MEDMNFPVYRKYRNGRSFFKIIHPTLVEEVQLVGSRRVIHRLEALLYPDKVFIADLLLDRTVAFEATEEEYLAAKGAD